jgi:hypothetical protein
LVALLPPQPASARTSADAAARGRREKDVFIVKIGLSKGKTAGGIAG